MYLFWDRLSWRQYVPCWVGAFQWLCWNNKSRWLTLQSALQRSFVFTLHSMLFIIQWRCCLPQGLLHRHMLGWCHEQLTPPATGVWPTQSDRITLSLRDPSEPKSQKDTGFMILSFFLIHIQYLQFWTDYIQEYQKEMPLRGELPH